jgi:hypothetical protein
MKIRLFIAAFLSLIILAGCSNLQIESTPIPLDQIDLAPIIYQDGDLPAGFKTAQVRAMLGDLADDAPEPVNFYSLSLENNGQNGGVVDILIYDNHQDAIDAYISASNNLPGSMHKAEVGESGSLSTNIMFIDAVSLTFMRCNTVVAFQFQGTTSQDAALSFAVRIDQRIQDSICDR